VIRAIAIRILRQVLLVIVGAEAFSCTEISGLSRRGQSTGRLSVYVAVDPLVDQTSVRSEQCPSLKDPKLALANGSIWGMYFQRNRAAYPEAML
jgi:hypothetical protein